VERGADRRAVGAATTRGLWHTEGIDYVHRRVGTEAELVRYLERWVGEPDYTTLYLAFHGKRGELELDAMIGLERLAELLGGACHGRVIHLSACGSLDVRASRIEDFLERTGADGILGYTGDVGWVEGAALDLLLLAGLATRASEASAESLSELLDQVGRDYTGLVENTTFDGRASGRSR